MQDLYHPKPYACLEAESTSMTTSGCVAPAVAENKESPAAHGVGCAVAMASLAHFIGFIRLRVKD